MSWYAGALTAAVVLTASLGSKGTLAGSGSAPPHRAQQRLWADEVSEAIRTGRAGATAPRDVARTGEIGKGASAANSGPGRGEGAATGSDRGKSDERGGGSGGQSRGSDDAQGGDR